MAEPVPAPGDPTVVATAPDAAAAPVLPAPAPVPSAPSHRVLREPRPAQLGRIALVLAVLMVLAVVTALLVDAPDRYLEATVIALVADALSAGAVIVGIVGFVRRRCRGAAVAAIAIAVLGNPLVLLYGLGALT